MFNCYVHGWSSHNSGCPDCVTFKSTSETEVFIPHNVTAPAERPVGYHFGNPFPSYERDTLTKRIAELEAENQNYRTEIDLIMQGRPSIWAYKILEKERDELKRQLKIFIDTMGKPRLGDWD